MYCSAPGSGAASGTVQLPGRTQRGTDIGSKPKDNIRSGDHSKLFPCCLGVLPFFRSGYLFFLFPSLQHACVLLQHISYSTCTGFFHEFFCTHMFIAPMLTASRQLELQIEMLVPNNPAFIATETYFKTSEKLILVISPPFPTRNASRTCRRFSLLLCLSAISSFPWN